MPNIVSQKIFIVVTDNVALAKGMKKQHLYPVHPPHITFPVIEASYIAGGKP